MKRIYLALATLTLISMLTVVSFALPWDIRIVRGTAPTIDGVISLGEYNDAKGVTFETAGGTCWVYFKHDAANLYVAFDVPNKDAGSAVQIFVDADGDQANAPQTDDWRFTISWDAGPGCYCGENQGTGTGWTGPMTDCDPHGTTCGWLGYWQEQDSAWTAEFGIPFTKLGINTKDIIGISFWNVWTSTGDHFWPDDADWMTPYTWGKAYISPSTVGGLWIPVNKLGLLAPYIGLASTIVVATAATAIYVKRVKRRK